MAFSDIISPLGLTKKVFLSKEDNVALRRWQEENAALRWIEVDKPWAGTLEGEVIAAMEPPLNVAENASHPFNREMKAARERFRQAAI